MREPSGRGAEIRARLDHPVVDADGHFIELMPAFEEYLARESDDGTVRAFRAFLANFKLWYDLDEAGHRATRLRRPPWWVGPPTDNLLDWATAVSPAILHSRLDRLGLDFVVIYPTFGLLFHQLPQPVSRAACRAYNRMCRDIFGPYARRIRASAIVPMHDPTAAVEDLRAAVAMGYRSVTIPNYVARVPPALADAFANARPEVRAHMLWYDRFGMDSEHDYDPFWRACADAAVPISFHTFAAWADRCSTSSYVYNHIGAFSSAHEATCKALFLGGVLRRFPTLRFAFLEGGAAWAWSLLNDLIGHWEKRNGRAIRRLDPAALDYDALARLLGETEHSLAPHFTADAIRATIALVEGAQKNRDEFAAADAQTRDQIAERFTSQLFFGCEADDRSASLAFSPKSAILGRGLRAFFGSDIAHWDVSDVEHVLVEAWELREEGLLTGDDFAAFTFRNAVDFFGPAFFAGTAIEGAVGDRVRT